jgi:hypothetical protein
MFPAVEESADTTENSAFLAEEEGSRSRPGMIIGGLLAVLIGAAAWIYFAHRPTADTRGIVAEQKTENRAAPQVAPLAPPVATAPSQSPGGTPGLPANPVTGAPPAETAPTTKSSTEHASGATASPRRATPLRGEASNTVAPGPEAGATELALAQGYLRGERGQRNSAAAVPVLWEAVKKGSVAAEVMLADLYARGDGVTKSCTQARVLLAAAAKKGNREALEKLPAIERGGCP